MMVHNKKILIVEDDASIRQILTEVLEFEGYETKSAINGRKGLEQLRRDRPDLIILDLMMPVMDGFQFKKIMDTDATENKIPVIVFSANTDKVNSEMGCVTALRKGTPLTQILDTIQILLN